MRKIFILVLLITSMAFAASGTISTAIDQQDIQTKQELVNKQECDMLIAKNATAEELQRSGCCSHHGGVCGCSNGRAACCDGSLSPSCGCD
ncbi:hypothetical protein [Sulfurovum sp.]|uniref:hypothetical protein n=1 Tax=Sulfurovum sp. TaxID=1969726 RepID=UPI0035693352